MKTTIPEMAPLEGVTTHIFRRTQAAMFLPASKYYTPFISPTQNHMFTTREMNEILPENNQGIDVVPQLIGHNAEDFLWAAGEIKSMGYKEVNLNLGCPSPTVTKKKKGAGLLGDLPLLKDFLDEIFDKCEMDISVKTRIGRYDYEETEGIAELFSGYPIKKLIVHPRLEKDKYTGPVSEDAFDLFCSRCSFPVYWNGDLFTCGDVVDFENNHGNIDGIMCGRGYIINPKLAGEVSGEPPLSYAELKEFHDVLLENVSSALKCEKPILLHMKEYWNFWKYNFDGPDKQIKAILKATTLPDYKSAVNSLMR